MAHTAAPLLPQPLIVRGHLVTIDNGTVIEDGALYIDANGVIQGVACAPTSWCSPTTATIPTRR